MAHPSKTRLGPLCFAVPRSLQRFDIFKKFPYDIRHLIWEEVIFTPGIHFLKLVETIDTPAIPRHVSTEANSGRSIVTLPDSQAAGVVSAEDLVYSATLKPIFPLPYADNSYHIAMNKTLAQLRESCDEAKSLVDKVLAQPCNLTLRGGQLILLHRSSDVVCIDYPNITQARYLGEWADHLDLDQLAKIRRLAVRYHHEWDNDLVCSYCGRVHSHHGRHPYPRHVYEFASLFRNLETFYFIDYLTVRKTPPSPNHPRQSQSSGRPLEKFASGEGGRTYFEVDPESCTTHTRVHETLSWIRNNYICHCISRSQGPPRPANVRFKVLACEWDSDQKLAATKRTATQTTPVKKKRTRNRTPGYRTSPQNLTIVDDPLSQPTNINILPVVFGDAGKSKFDFSLEIPH